MITDKLENPKIEAFGLPFTRRKMDPLAKCISFVTWEETVARGATRR